jgi:GT2 family glycosyltransferase
MSETDMVAETGGSILIDAAAADVPIAFVLPALNEEKYLPETLESIRRLLKGRISYELVVVDNGSTDGTVQLAQQHGAATFILHGVTVGAMRNHGARHSFAPVLVFLDADVVLTTEWAANIEMTLRKLRAEPMTITGSACGVPGNAKWLERNWFGPWRTGRTSHMNSGHMIIARTVFEDIGGFDERLKTGEDYEFSLRAQNAGVKLVSNPQLAVVHNGYPKTLGAFMRREAWHGRSDFDSVRTILQSKIAIAVLVFSFLHVALFAALVVGSITVAAGALGGIISICVAAAFRQYRHENPVVVLSNSAIYYVYFAARFGAFLNALLGRTSFVHREHR